MTRILPAPADLPPLVPVQSSHLKGVAYNERTGDMTVQFKDGGVYSYHGVPSNIHGELMGAPSKGKFFRQAVKGRFRTTPLRRA